MHLIRGNVHKILLIVASLSQLGTRAQAQARSHVVLVKLVSTANAQFAFEPAAVVAQRGDTVRFIQASTAPHNVHFLKTPKGATLGKAASGPYIIGVGKTYDLAIDTRFVDGTYQFTCDPHQSIGMNGTLTIGSPAR